MQLMADTEDTVFLTNTEPNNPLSRYNKLRVLLGVADIPVLETLDPVTITELPTDTYIEVKPEWANRPDLIALEYLGYLELWWVIGAANDMVDPFAQCGAGVSIRIPDYDNLFTEVLG